MTDKREEVLARLVEIAAAVDGVTTVVRNGPAPDETKCPVIQILDADESAEESDPVGVARGSSARRRVGMTPEIYIILGDLPENVGPALNALRAKLVKAILTDAELGTILGTNGAIRYEGCATGLSRARQMEGSMGVSFTFLYILNPAAL
jgi:hypothetical protein